MESASKSFEQQLEEALRENQELQRQLEECSVARKATNEEMEHFIYAVSHDFRQPLRTMSSYAQLLQRQYQLDEQASEMTAFIVTGANELRSLIEDLLKYSRTGQSLRRMTVQLESVVQWAALNLKKEMDEAGARITQGELPELLIDESQFVQLFQQLFSNSLKFRSAEAPKIKVTAEEHPDGYLISVRDNGLGIESKYHESVFTPFKRLHGKDVPGTGLGLSICRKIVRAHGGKIWVESDGSNGSVFQIQLPY